MTGDDAAGRPARDIRVLVADDEALVRAGFIVLVDSAPGLLVVGEASNGVKAVRQARALKPDVVLMDIRMPVMGGLEATRLILDGDQEPPPRILVVTTFDEDEHVFEALRSGASGFVLKDTPPERLLEAIAIVAAGEALLAPAITRRLIAEFARRPRSRPTSAGCCPSSTAATAPSSSWSHTRPASPSPASADTPTVPSGPPLPAATPCAPTPSAPILCGPLPGS